MSELARQNVSGAIAINNVDDLSRVSKMLVTSRFFSDCTEAAQAGVKVMAGLEIGVPAFAAMTGIHIIKGKPSIGAGIMSAKVKSSGTYWYEELEHSDTVCKLAFFEAEMRPMIRELKLKVAKGEIKKAEYSERLETLALGVSTFTIADAKKAGTQNIEKFPRNMLFARAMSNGVKWYCPDVFLMSVYVPEELGATVDADGHVIDVEVSEPRLHAIEPSTETASTVSVVLAENAVERTKALAEMMGYTNNEIKKVRVAAKLPEVKAMTEAEFEQFRDALFIDWGLRQNKFKAYQHASNGLNAVKEEAVVVNEGLDDDGWWMLWSSYVNAHEPVAPVIEAEVA